MPRSCVADAGGQERVAGRRSRALAHAIEEASEQGDRPHKNERQDELGKGARAIAGQHERAALPVLSDQRPKGYRRLAVASATPSMRPRMATGAARTPVTKAGKSG